MAKYLTEGTIDGNKFYDFVRGDLIQPFEALHS